jgi:pyruvate dehydrogenase E1 component alpha subunit
VDGNDVEAVHRCVARAVANARRGDGPTIVEAVTYRNAVFSGADRGGYQDPAEAARFIDPLSLARMRLIDNGTSPDQVDAVEHAARQEVADAVAFAGASPWPDAAELTAIATKWDGRSRS